MRPAILIISACVLVACGRDLLNPLDAGGTGGGSGGGSQSGGGGGGSTCPGLSVDACRARSDCAADFCFQCSCTPQFEGCRPITAQPFDCPQLGCASPLCCQTGAQCGSSGDCAPPGTRWGCGFCDGQPSTCANDTGCGTSGICEPRQCGCSGETDCVPGCGPTNPCLTGTTCTGKRCQPSSCSSSTSCPSGFDCQGGLCARRSCTRDLDCGDGFCVTGLCSEGWGECRGPVP